MDLAVTKSQKDVASRFKRNNDTTASNTTNTSAYLAQKNEYTKMAGSKGEDTGKWLVR